MKAEAPERERLPYAYFPRPRCPLCNSPDLKIYKTVDNGDGSIVRYSKCRSCGEKFKLILE